MLTVPEVNAREHQLRRLSTALGLLGPTDDESGSIDASLFELAKQERLTPLVGARLVAGRARCTSAAIAEEARRDHQLCVARSLFFDTAMQSLVGPLVSSGIPVLCLKGMALVRTVFAPGERSMTDLDVLVPASRWRETLARATEAGAVVYDPYGRPYTALHDYAVPMRTPEGLIVEVHRYLCERPFFSPDYEGDDGLFARATRADDDLLVPEPADLFLGLALHAAHHSYHLPFRAIVDGLTLDAAGLLDPARIAARAARWNARRALGVWIATLARFGLDAKRWRQVLDWHRFAVPVLDIAQAAPLPESEVSAKDWRRLAQATRLMDSLPRRLYYLGHRVTLRAMDGLAQRFPALVGRG